MDGRKTLQTVVEELEKKIKKDGLASLCESGSSVACPGCAEKTGDIRMPGPIPWAEAVNDLHIEERQRGKSYAFFSFIGSAYR